MAGAVGGFLAGSLGLFGSSAGALTVGGAIAAVSINTALFIGLNAATNSLLRPKAGKTLPRDRVVRGGTQPQMIGYGRSVVGGYLNYQNSFPIEGDSNYEMWAVITHVAHESEDIIDVYYDADQLENGTHISWSTGVDDDSEVTSGDWAASDATKRSAKIWKRLGTSTQTMPTELTDAFSDLDTNFRGRGYTATVHKWQFFDESEDLFKQGEPGNIRVLGKWRKIYDPRLDTTEGGSGSHRWNDPSTWAWSHNPILCAADYMMNYWEEDGIDGSRFDWDHIRAQADVCDVSAATPGGSQDRYSCNGVLSLGDPHEANLAQILMCCLGHRSVVNGLIRFTAGDDASSGHSFDETDVVGSIVNRPSMPRADRYNKVVGTYRSELNDYQETEFLSVEDAGFVSRDDGKTRPRTIVLDMVVNEYQAQRIAYKLLQQSDQPLTAEVPMRWSGLRLTPGGYFDLTNDKFNWSSKLLQCTGLKVQERGVPIIATFKEDSSTAWDDPTSPDDYSTRSALGVITKAATAVPPPTSMTVTPMANGNLVEWVNPSDRSAWDYVDVYASATSAWGAASRVATGIRAGSFAHVINPGLVRYYWVRSVKNGVESDREPNSDTSDRTATSATVIDSGGGSLDDDEVLNDYLDEEWSAGSHIKNGHFHQGVKDAGGLMKPLHWFRRTNADTLEDAIYYTDPDVRDYMRIDNSSNRHTAILLSEAFFANPDSQYEIGIRARQVSGTLTDIAVDAYYLTGNIGGGGRAVSSFWGGTDNDSGVDSSGTKAPQSNGLGNHTFGVLNTWEQWTATIDNISLGAKWISVGIATPDTDAAIFEIDFVFVRDKATRNTGALADLDTVDENEIIQGSVGQVVHTTASDTTITSGTYTTIITSGTMSPDGGKAIVVATVEASTDGAPGSSSHDDGAVRLKLQTNTNGGGWVDVNTTIVGARNDGTSDVNWYIPFAIQHGASGITTSIQARLQAQAFDIGNGIKNTDLTSIKVTIFGTKR